MSGIPTQGYGSFGEWRRRQREEPERMIFYINGATEQSEVTEWRILHTQNHVPAKLHSLLESAQRWAG